MIPYALAIAAAFLLSFAAAFSICSAYIHHKRKTRRRYHYHKPAEPPSLRRDMELNTDIPTGVDGDTARWE